MPLAKLGLCLSNWSQEVARHLWQPGRHVGWIVKSRPGFELVYFLYKVKTSAWNLPDKYDLYYFNLLANPDVGHPVKPKLSSVNEVHFLQCFLFRLFLFRKLLWFFSKIFIFLLLLKKCKCCIISATSSIPKWPNNLASLKNLD